MTVQQQSETERLWRLYQQAAERHFVEQSVDSLIGKVNALSAFTSAFLRGAHDRPPAAR